jgi:hypothetical protein
VDVSTSVLVLRTVAWEAHRGGPHEVQREVLTTGTGTSVL